MVPQTRKGSLSQLILNANVIDNDLNATSHGTYYYITVSNQLTPINNCASSWGTFRRGESVLTTTQVIQRPNPPPPFDISTVNDEAFRKLFIDPASNFAFCSIQKVACTQWDTVLRNVFQNKTNKGYAFPQFKLGLASQKKHGIHQIKRIFESPTSTVAVMVRDPLARFASVYLNKCFDIDCGSPFCLARTSLQLPIGQPISFRQVLEWVLSNATNVKNIDGHWSLQSERCGIVNGGLDNYYSHVVLLTKETLNQDASCLMEQAGIQRYNINGIGNDTFWDSGGVKYKKYRKESEDEVLRKLFTPELARQFMTKFQQDYDTFQLPEPDWVKDATGEWLDSLDHHECLEKAWR